MSSLACSFCQHANPADAKFCNDCGSPLNLEPCASCDAVNDVAATQCHRCGAPLHGAPTGARHDVVDAVKAVRPEASRTSIVKALETVEADLASFGHAEPVATAASASDAAQDGPEVHASPSSRARRLRPALLVAFVACALVAVLFGPRVPLPPALTRASLATASLVSADKPKEPASSQRIAAAPLPAKALARTSAGPIEAITPHAQSVPAFAVSEAQTPVAPAPLPAVSRSAAAFHDVGGLPYPVPRERCTDGVAAMALCNREGANDVP